jgi:hypothetical protein
VPSVDQRGSNQIPTAAPPRLDTAERVRQDSGVIVHGHRCTNVEGEMNMAAARISASTPMAVTTPRTAGVTGSSLAVSAYRRFASQGPRTRSGVVK